MSDAFETLLKRKRDDADDEYAPKAATAKRSKPKAATSVGTCSLNKKDFGDRIKVALRLEKYEAQGMRINVRGLLAFIRPPSKSMRFHDQVTIRANTGGRVPATRYTRLVILQVEIF
ncbi:hypothetical protein C8R45DRAFT_1095117 [Mycena sanguinolenta]|nr:hypothetical protein C8R45DRAFT_1095117 [Mycena sanguinolenta]